MKKLTRRDFLRNLRDLGIGVGLLPLARRISELPVETIKEEEVVNEAVAEWLQSDWDSMSAVSGAEIAAMCRGNGIEIKRACGTR